MRAFLDDAALIQHHDQVGIHHTLDAMGDDEGGAPNVQAAQRLTDEGLGFGIHRGGRVVQDQDARVFEQRAGDRDALLLPARQGDALFADQCIVSMGEGHDHVMHRRHLRRLFHLGLGQVAPHAIRDVLADRAREQERLLLHRADLAAQELG